MRNKEGSKGEIKEVYERRCGTGGEGIRTEDKRKKRGMIKEYRKE
jgi:hypothetical protein